MKNGVIGLAVLALLVSGCTGNTFQRRYGPESIHDPESVSRKVGDTVEDGKLLVGNVLLENYFRTLVAARAEYNFGAGTARTQVPAYVRAGVRLVELHCARWFDELDALAQRRQFQDKQQTIIQHLGTALIGVGRLHPDVTAIYGAGNTALTGTLANFDAVFLSATKVKGKILAEVTQKGEAMIASSAATGSPAPLYFPDAYSALEKLAGICTPGAVKTFVDAAVLSQRPMVDDKSLSVTGAASVAGGAGQGSH